MDAEVDWGMEDDFDPWQAGSAPPPKSEEDGKVGHKENQEPVTNLETEPEEPSQLKRHIFALKRLRLIQYRGTSHNRQEAPA